MKVVVIEPPTPVVTLEDAVLHCKVEENLDHPLVQAYIDAATGWLDGPAGWLGRALGVQVLEWQRCDWPCNEERFPFPPLIEVLSVKYIDPAGVEQTWPIPDPFYFEDMPAVRGRQGDVKIRYRAGYGSLAGDPAAWVNSIPPAIWVSILLLVGNWYENRQAIVLDKSPTQLPLGVEQLLAPFRVWSVD